MVIFREAERYNVSLFRMITVNYWVCVACGITFTDDFLTVVEHSPKDWLPLAILQGCLFISLFFLIGQASQKVGVAYTAMITKVSVIFPVLIGLVVFNEPMGIKGYLGIIFALASIVLLHLKYLDGKKGLSALPLTTLLGLSTILFFGSGATDSIFTIFKHLYDRQIPETIFSIVIFGIAGLIGISFSIVNAMRNGDFFSRRELIGGIILGIPNYFSIYFLMDALQYMNASQLFPVLNISILLVSGVVGYFRYQETFKLSTWIGMALAIGAIVLMA
jgi:drug/metabolite transporter (DMT)-like permease